MCSVEYGVRVVDGDVNMMGLPHVIMNGADPSADQRVASGGMFFFSSRRRHTRLQGDWSSDVCSSDLVAFAFAHFINPRGGDAVARGYRKNFSAGRDKEPRVIVCTFAICGATDDEAERLAAPIDLRRLHMALNIDSPVPTAEEAARHAYSDEERRYVLGQRERAVIGG